MSLKGIKCPKALWLYSDSETINPARKAPNASESPREDVSNATARQISRMLIMNNSWFFVMAMALSNLGISQRLPINISMIINAALPMRTRYCP